ncbi:MAG: hypothetical protein Q8N54_13570, partial [Sulfurimicrobium sp.]|nr:hypothetical protein [Sulfurimicrobium sp.]
GAPNKTKGLHCCRPFFLFAIQFQKVRPACLNRSKAPTMAILAVYSSFMGIVTQRAEALSARGNLMPHVIAQKYPWIPFLIFSPPFFLLAS